jgi:pimeloyl-ACP methyl ester carboxylesterase
MIVRASVVSEGDSPALVLLPGALLGPSPELVERLSSGRRVIVLAYPDATRMTDLVEAIAARLAAAGVERADVLGSSYGGWVAQCLARRHPRRVRRLVLVHTFALRPSDARRFRLGMALWRAVPESCLRRLLALRVTRLLRPAREASAAEYRRLAAVLGEAVRSPAALDALHRQNACLLESCASFGLGPGDRPPGGHPVLIVEADDDPAIRAGARARLRALYPGARVRTFHGTGHVTAVAAPEAFAGVVNDFLTGAD